MLNIQNSVSLWDGFKIGWVQKKMKKIAPIYMKTL